MFQCFRNIILIVVFLSLRFVALAQQFKSPYQFDKPQSKIVLPNVLHEVSGIVVLDSVTIACVQDEIGTVYIYSLLQNKIINQLPFASLGDYEGITTVNQSLFILRSDGVLFEIEDYQAQKISVKEYKTSIPAINNEGLCYDENNKRLLIGAKGKINHDPAHKNFRYIYEFNLTTKKLNPQPIYTFTVSDVNSQAKQLGFQFEVRHSPKGKVIEKGLKFNTSEIAIHPITKQLYVLSASDYCLLVYTHLGELLYIERLNPLLFRKAEGMSFFEDGTLLISNEGKNETPTLLQFHYTP